MGQMKNHIRRNETIDYIRAMLEQLYPLAKTQGCEMLAYLIEMACIEASDIAYEALQAASAASDAPHNKGNSAA